MKDYRLQDAYENVQEEVKKAEERYRYLRGVLDTEGLLPDESEAILKELSYNNAYRRGLLYALDIIVESMY